MTTKDRQIELYKPLSTNAANGKCTTAADEAGKQRKSCVDGLAA